HVPPSTDVDPISLHDALPIFPVQPVGIPIRRHISPVPPDGSHFLSTDGLPNVLPIPDLLLREQDVAVGGDHPFGDGGHRLVDFTSVITQNGEGKDENKDQTPPKSGEIHD